MRISFQYVVTLLFVVVVSGEFETGSFVVGYRDNSFEKLAKYDNFLSLFQFPRETLLLQKAPDYIFGKWMCGFYKDGRHTPFVGSNLTYLLDSDIFEWDGKSPIYLEDKNVPKRYPIVYTFKVNEPNPGLYWQTVNGLKYEPKNGGDIVNIREGNSSYMANSLLSSGKYLYVFQFLRGSRQMERINLETMETSVVIHHSYFSSSCQSSTIFWLIDDRYLWSLCIMTHLPSYYTVDRFDLWNEDQMPFTAGNKIIIYNPNFAIDWDFGSNNSIWILTQDRHQKTSWIDIYQIGTDFPALSLIKTIPLDIPHPKCLAVYGYDSDLPNSEKELEVSNKSSNGMIRRTELIAIAVIALALVSVLVIGLIFYILWKKQRLRHLYVQFH